TWQRNTYPGLQCDVASPLYCYSFAPNPDWSGPYPPQPEIREYLERVALEHGLEPHLRLGLGVASATWDESKARWQLVLSDGQEVESQFVISAVGMFGPPAVPNIPGLDSFPGKVFHSAEWDHEHDLKGKRVAVIGTAASAVQFIPEIAPEPEQLHIFQRTANWVPPKMNEPYTDEQKASFKAQPEILEEARQNLYTVIETVLDYTKPGGLQMMEDGAREAFAVVEDPEVRKKLTPDHPMGAKRPLSSSKYLQTFNRPNVELVTDSISEVSSSGIMTADGVTREVDTIILATGFETQKYVSVIDVKGRGGQSIEKAWADGAEAYFGVTTSGFPNLFMLYGPNTNGGNSIILMLEFQIDYALRLIEEAEGAKVDWIDVRPDVMKAFNVELQERLNEVAVWQSGANDYYRAPSGKIVTQWPLSFSAYEEKVAKDGLDSFETGRAD
ncbi:MAG: flavin-containing monooxygenase, partial [Myxococcota bacterium]